MGVEIEKKFTVKKLPENLDQYPYHVIEQGYLNVSPAIRVRREDDSFYMTYKGSSVFQGTGMAGNDALENEGGPQQGDIPIGKTEYNLPLDEESYGHLIAKADGNVIRKKRYLIPINEDAFEETTIEADEQLKKALDNGDVKIELDVFGEPFEGRVLAEVEFPTEESARMYKAAPWFDRDVTKDPSYSNARMSREKF